MRDSPAIFDEGKEATKYPSHGTITIPQNHGQSYALKDKKKANPDEGIGKLLFPFSFILDRVYGLLLSGGVLLIVELCIFNFSLLFCSSLRFTSS